MSGKAAASDPPPAQAAAAAGAPATLPPNVAYDLTLQHPRCVFQLLKKHYSRYTPEIVERITGIPKAQFLKAADLFTSVRKDGDLKKAATIIYAVGWTQHTFGTQIIRTRSDAAAPDGEHWASRRRHQRTARPFEHSGRHGHGRHLRQPAWLSQGADPCRSGLGGVSETDHADFFETRSVGLVQLLVEHAEVCGFVSESDCMATPQPNRMILPFTIFRKWTATIPGLKSGTTCTAAR